MATKPQMSRFTRKFLAKYIYWIETIGFIFVGCLIVLMVGSVVYKIDDGMKFANIPAAELREAIEVKAPAYVESVLVKEGDRVEAGQPVAEVKGGLESQPLLDAAHSI